MSISAIIRKVSFALRFGITGGLIGTLIFSPFDPIIPRLNLTVSQYILFALGFGWILVGIPAATIAGLVFSWFHKRGLANGHQERSWWIACLVSALPLILLKVYLTASAGNLQAMLAHTVWTCLFFLVCVVLTARVLEMFAQRQYKRLALLGVVGLGWFMFPAAPPVNTLYPG